MNSYKLNAEHRTPNVERRREETPKRCDSGIRCAEFNVSRSTFSVRRRSARAFTLVEMLLVLVILATLAAIVIPKMAGRGKQAQETAAKQQISSFELALDTFEVDNGFFPKSLDALIDQPSGAQNWKGPYLKKAVSADPWGNAYVYTYPGKNNANGYDLLSSGPDGQSGTDDDLTNWDAKK